MIRKIVGVKDPVLRGKAKPVSKVDKKIVELVSDMKDTLNAQKDPEGVGLAAPQIGKSLRVFVINHKNTQRVVINPVVLKASKISQKKEKNTKQKREILEGCLSLPNYYGPIERKKMIKLQYLNEKGEKLTEKFTGFLAQIVQHEIDHLEGKLFIDHILSQKAPLYHFSGNEWEEVELI